MIEVVLATRNGDGTLARTLAAFGGLERPNGGWRLIVIDNGSTDGTAALLQRHRARLPLTVLDEPRPGKNIALNAALPLLGDGLAVFIDDDILPEPDWLLALEAVAAAHPDHAVFAGRILPQWDAEPPDWLLAWVDLRICFGIHAEIPEGPCSHDVVYGGNMAIRSTAFREGYRYDESFGPNALTSFAMGGETDLARRLGEVGRGLWFARGAIVRHIVSPEQMTRRWLLDRARNFGRGQYRVAADPVLSGGGEIAPRLRRAIVASRWRALLAGLGGNPKERFDAAWRANYLAGLAIEHRSATEHSRPARASGGKIA